LEKCWSELACVCLFHSTRVAMTLEIISKNSHRMAQKIRCWSGVRGLVQEERAVAFLSGLHERLGKGSKLRTIDYDIAKLIFFLSEERATKFVETKPPSPGCSLFGFMFDVKGLGDSGKLVTALKIFSSGMSGAKYDIYAAVGTWRNKDSRHLPSSPNQLHGKWYSVAQKVPASSAGGKLRETPYQPMWINLQIPVYVPSGEVASLYIHSSEAWGAVAYRMLDDTGCQVAPGIETSRDEGISFLTGTFTESSEPFEDVDGFVCEFAGGMEYDVVAHDTWPWTTISAVKAEEGNDWTLPFVS